MRGLSEVKFGKLAITPMPPVARPQLGGRRPPRDPDRNRRSSALARLAAPRRGPRSRDWLRFCAALAMAATAPCVADAQLSSSALPDLSGSYRCEGHEAACNSSGTVFTVTQSGADLEIKNDKGDIGNAKLTSNITLTAGPIWNMLGVITSPDNNLIQWSNGTSWRKQ
jgi:hypothetical protein